MTPSPLTIGLDHKGMTAHIRKRVKVSKIKARVDMMNACGVAYIRVFVPAFGLKFSDDEQRTIRTIAKLNGLTFARGSEIDPEQMTNPDSMHFEFHG